MNLGEILIDEDLLKHFDGKPTFKIFLDTWSPQDKSTFCRLVRIIHAAGLDWWHIDKRNEVRFGRKNPGDKKAITVLGLIVGVNPRNISWRHNVGRLSKFKSQPLTDDLVDKIENTLIAERETLGNLFVLETERPGLWPDQLQYDPLESADEESMDEMESDGEESPMDKAVTQAFNRIYYGPPGTGKTYKVSKLLRKQYEQVMSSVSNEEWSNDFIKEKVASLTWWEAAAAALYDLKGRAKIDTIFSHPFMKAIEAKKSSKSGRNTLWGVMQLHSIEDSKTVNVSRRSLPAVFEKNDDSSWVFAGEWENVSSELKALVTEYRAGPPASKSLKRYSFVTFHQSYGYEEFVEGLRPLLDDDTELGAIKYEIRSGAFKELCRKARLSPDQRFAMVIDEINRGNISKIFGELITLIEPDKREGNENAISVILPYSGESFSIPPNVDIIGTMNTADRSLALLDTALRRRFDFVPVLPNTRDEEDAPLFNLRVTEGEQIIDIRLMLSAINQRIETLYDRDHCIGHAYFTSLKNVPDGKRLEALSQTFSNRIIPLLEEYFFEDWQKIMLVLADNQKPEADRFVIKSKDHEDDLTQLFGSNHGLDTYTTTQRYVVQNESFKNPNAYIGIYQPLPA